MIYRLGRHRRRNLYAQHGREPSNDDGFVALFEDEAMAARVCRLLNADEARHFGETTTAVDLHEERLLDALRRSFPLAERPCGNPVCGHPQSQHIAYSGGVACTNPDPNCTCVEFVDAFASRTSRGMFQILPDNWKPGLTAEALADQERHNPFCQRDGCLHPRAAHEWGSSACRDCNGCAAFVEAHP